MKYFAGIGSRTIPEPIKQYIIDIICPLLVNANYVLRSGGADGSDLAFETGFDKAGGKKEIYIPWMNFNNSDSRLVGASPDSYDMARKFHPGWNNLSHGAKSLHARNCCQVLGEDLKTPSSFILCYTKDGAETKKEITRETGGTGQALRIAAYHGIKIINIKNYFDNENLLNQLSPDDLLKLLRNLCVT